MSKGNGGTGGSSWRDSNNSAKNYYYSHQNDDAISLSEIYGTKYDEVEATIVEHLWNESEANAHEEVVSLDGLHSVQEEVFPTTLKDYIAGQYKHDAVEGELPLIAKVGDKYFVHDGNHRVAAAIIKGDKKIRANVKTLSEKDFKKLKRWSKTNEDKFYEAVMGF